VKKIIGIGITAAVVITLVATGTLALFSDTETAVDNTFEAGTLNLEVGSADPCTETIAIGDDEDLYPTQSGNAATWLTHNSGSIAGDLSIELSTITNNENTILEPEAAESDVTDDPDGGELGSLLEVAFWMDVNKSGDWSSGDYYLSSSETKVVWATGTALPTAAYATLDSYDSDSWADVQNVAKESDAGNFRVEYNWPDGGSSDNTAHSDDCVFTITFELEQ
jgi:predicted ribosomally synthesized peptide with SipW-like signal peptide